MKTSDCLDRAYQDHLEYKNYSDRTIKSYCSSLRIFRKYIAEYFSHDSDEMSHVKEFFTNNQARRSYHQNQDGNHHPSDGTGKNEM